MTRSNRITPRLLWFAVPAAYALSIGCSSGLETETNCIAAPVPSLSGNVTTGLFFGFEPRLPGSTTLAIYQQPAIAAGVIPGVTPESDQHVAFYGFTTLASADNAGAPGAGNRLGRDGTADMNGVNDVFVAAVVQERVDTRAFSYSLAGKFRHPRCVNCHSVSKEPGFGATPVSTVFHASAHPTVEGVQAPQPGQGRFQNTNENSCLTCHEAVLDAGAPEGGGPLTSGWRNPKTSASADFRVLSTAELADRARRAPAGHFEDDRRVNWALADATVPSLSIINGPFGAADDDHDGIVEPFDSDNRRRAVPGGRAMFQAEIDAFLCGGGPDDTRGALADVVLASRAGDQAPNAASDNPDIAYVPDSSFDPAVGGVAGSLYTVFESAATDIDPLATSGTLQVYRSAINVVVSASGAISLIYRGVQLVSTNAAGSEAGNGDSFDPVISSLPSAPGAANAGQRVAFLSDANNLGPNGGLQRVYVHDLDSNVVVRAGSTMDNCRGLAMDPTGRVLAFSSTDVSSALGVSDSNGVSDVYFTRISSGPSAALESNFPQRASRTNGVGGESDEGISVSPDIILDPSELVDGEERILIAFNSSSILDARGIDPSGATVASNVFVHAFAGLPASGPQRGTFQVSLGRSITGELVYPDDLSGEPTFPGRPDRLVFSTDSTNLDSAFLMPPDPDFGTFTFKSGDENGETDIMMANLGGILDGSASARVTALSVSPAGAFGDASTSRPIATTFGSNDASGAMVVGGLTTSTNLGVADVRAAPLGIAVPWMSFVRDAAPLPSSQFDRVSSMLRNRCAPCHAVGGANAGGFGMGADDDALFFELLNDSRSCSGTPTPYVMPGLPDMSLIVQAMEGPTCNMVRMPQGSAAVPDDLIQIVRDWIASGAPRND